MHLFSLKRCERGLRSRIWTIFEQYSAVVLEIEVTFILPQASGESLLQEIRKAGCESSKVPGFRIENSYRSH